jgi:electron transport complex protein RnfC
MGAEKQLIQTLTGKETPAGTLTAVIGVVVHNAATAVAVHDAVRHGRPLIDRVVTVSGGAVAKPRNIQAPFGTPIFDLLEFCGGLKEEPEVILVGGPMMGQPIKSVHAPILKGTNGVLALTKAETASRTRMPCIRCSSCVSACPAGLVPLEMAARVKKDELDSAVQIGLMDCISCGACSYVCPSNIPLVQYFNYAKGRLKALDEEQRKQRLTRKLAVLRKTRMEEQMRAKKEAFAKRKAEQEAQAAKLAAEKAAAEKAAGSAEPSAEGGEHP